MAVFAFVITVYMRKAYHRQWEEVIAKSDALQAANATKNKLLSIIGHDLKEPNHSLQSYLEILVKFDLEEEEQRQFRTSAADNDPKCFDDAFQYAIMD